MSKFWKWIEHNRFLVMGLLLSVVVAVSCTEPQVPSPLDPGRLVNSVGLKLDFKQWVADSNMVARFEAAGEDLTKQAERNNKVERLIADIAANPTNWPGILFTGGGIGAIIDNIRKRGLISGLKIKAKA